MGMYTELKVDCILHKLSSVEEKALEWLVSRNMSGIDEPEFPKHEFFKEDRRCLLFWCDIDVCKGHKPVFQKDVSGMWILKTHAQIKNYNSEIQKFCNWLYPFVKKGNLENSAFAESIYDETIEGCTSYFVDHVENNEQCNLYF